MIYFPSQGKNKTKTNQTKPNQTKTTKKRKHVSQEAPESFSGRKTILVHQLISKNRELHISETSCMKWSSGHTKNMWIKQLSFSMVRDSAKTFRVRKLFGIFEERTSGCIQLRKGFWILGLKLFSKFGYTSQGCIPFSKFHWPLYTSGHQTAIYERTAFWFRAPQRWGAHAYWIMRQKIFLIEEIDICFVMNMPAINWRHLTL